MLYAIRRMSASAYCVTVSSMPKTSASTDAFALRRERHAATDHAARVLAQAFRDDPVSTYVWPDGNTRVARAERSFGAQLHVLGDRREIHVHPSGSSVAVWARPNEWKVPLLSGLRALPTIVRTRVGLRSLLAYQRVDALHPDEPHWYLEFAGTVPERQGEGLGQEVLAAGLTRAAAEGTPVWAWSSNRRNLAFYRRLGFVVLSEVQFAAGGPTIFPIRRDPRG